MITLPNPEFLADRIQDALDEIDVQHRASPFTNPRWFPAIVSAINTRVQQPGLQFYARGTPTLCSGSEWLFDYCALLFDLEVPDDQRFPAQAAVIGEIEWDAARSKIDDDFEKLLVADALVLFMIIQQYSMDEAEAELTRLEHAVRRRLEIFRLRKCQPPIFLLSCWVVPTGPFIHRRIGANN